MRGTVYRAANGDNGVVSGGLSQAVWIIAEVDMHREIIWPRDTLQANDTGALDEVSLRVGGGLNVALGMPAKASMSLPEML